MALLDLPGSLYNGLRGPFSFHRLVQGGIYLFLLAISLAGFRYVPFFVLVTSFWLAEATTGLPKGGSKAFMRLLPKFTAAFALGALFLFAATGYGQAMGQSVEQPVDERRFPAGASTFLAEELLQGEIFNHMNWGGYLAWNLYPSHKVFIDGRVLSRRAFEDYTKILWLENYDQLLEKYGVNVCVIPRLNPFSHELYNLTRFMHGDAGWHLVYIDETAMVLVRGRANGAVVKANELPKEMIYDYVIRDAQSLLASGKEDKHIWSALFVAYREKGLLGKASEALTRARAFR